MGASGAAPIEMKVEEDPLMSIRTPRNRQSRPGFTLIELLTVIAIIAVLAAILYPVMTIARQNARKGGCKNNLQTIVQALKMYYDDWGVYPDSLMGVEYSPAGAYAGQPFAYRLAREYVKDDNAFTCPEHPRELKGSTASSTRSIPSPARGWSMDWDELSASRRETATTCSTTRTWFRVRRT